MKLNFITHEEVPNPNSLSTKEYKFQNLNNKQPLRLAPILPYYQRQKQREVSLPSLKNLKIYKLGYFYAYAKYKSSLPSPQNSSFETSSSVKDSSSSPNFKSLECATAKYDNSLYKPHRQNTPLEEELLTSSPRPQTNLSKRTSISKQQTSILNEYYSLNHYPNQDQKLKLAKLLKLSERTIQIWFQNRRQNRRTKYSFLRD